MHPEVSVILPYYNAELTLQKAIDSILNQSFRDYELLLVDNNSTDHSTKIAHNAAQNDARIKLLQETKPGVANAMNCGLQNSRGNYIVRMDADDISHPKRLEKQLDFLEENPSIDFVGSEVMYIPHITDNNGFRRFVSWTNAFHTAEEITLKQFIEIPVVNPTIFFRRKLFEAFGACLDGNFPEDYEMQLRYLSKGVKMAKLPDKLLEWHDYSTRLTRTDERYSTEAFFQTKAIYFNKWSKQHNPFHPHIWIWGAGRKTRQRATFLQKERLNIQGWIDIKKEKPGVLFYEDLPRPGKMFIVSMVTNAGAGEKIKKFLLKRNYKEGIDFMLMG